MIFFETITDNNLFEVNVMRIFCNTIADIKQKKNTLGLMLHSSQLLLYILMSI